MTHFHLQEINGRNAHDFSFHLQEAIQYHQWYRGETVYTWSSGENPTNKQAVPVGSLEFVADTMRRQYGIDKRYIIPLNVPDALNVSRFTKREITVVPYEDLPWGKMRFIKSATRYKGFTAFMDQAMTRIDVPADTYFISEKIAIDSEWRAFVHHGELLDIRSYSGDFALFPDVALVKEMIRHYQEAPPAYTLDVGVSAIGTFIIEVHPFVSCGLYGFNDYRHLPQMMIDVYRYFRESAELQQRK